MEIDLATIFSAFPVYAHLNLWRCDDLNGKSQCRDTLSCIREELGLQVTCCKGWEAENSPFSKSCLECRRLDPLSCDLLLPTSAEAAAAAVSPGLSMSNSVYDCAASRLFRVLRFLAVPFEAPAEPVARSLAVRVEDGFLRRRTKSQSAQIPTLAC